ncbi:coiled-coil domain-containing protein 187 [Callorhinchus milii]|uniref:coiled-coil domain-containing protein 187 n=1 Tax=Callorhinchus milii TaxID=7868 RepID=UPI001C3F816F|nr:coiled-coil domain-containing protein 187 [Callorhinchus milii]
MAEIAIDQSRLPRVQEVCRGFALLEDGALAHSLQEQEIEQHYASNVQKSQLVRQDVRVAKILQDQEERQARSHSREEQSREEQDSQYARAVQEEIHSRATERHRREEEDKEIARRLQEEEELRRREEEGQEDALPPPAEEVHSELGGGAGIGAWSLERGTARLGIRDPQHGEQLPETEGLRGDEELARHLQQEEETRLEQMQSQSQKSREEDFRVAQVAQDEEIARFIQRQELKAQKQAEEAGTDYERTCHRDGVREKRSSRAGGRGERLRSVGMASGEWTRPREDTSMEHVRKARQLFPRNIAEALDPTFKTQNTDVSQPEPHSPLTPEMCGSCPVPPGGLYDYMDDNSEPEFIPPTRRPQEKLPRQKSKDKKESCKQQ